LLAHSFPSAMHATPTPSQTYLISFLIPIPPLTAKNCSS
jgi:hypothetical protein